jgi:hypothetical protein
VALQRFLISGYWLISVAGAQYLAAVVREVGICDRDGRISFYGPAAPLERSAIFPDFPQQIPATFLRHGI